MEGVLLLSEEILANTECRCQHSEVLEHMMELVNGISQKYGEKSPIIKKTVHLLNARYDCMFIYVHK